MNWTARDYELLADAPYAQTPMLEGIPDQGCSSYYRELDVTIAGRRSPRETHTLGLDCDWRLRKW